LPNELRVKVTWVTPAVIYFWALEHSVIHLSAKGLIDLLDTTEENPLTIEKRQRLTHAILHLPDCERLVFTLWYYEESTKAEIGLLLDETESYIPQIHASALSTSTSALTVQESFTSCHSERGKLEPRWRQRPITQIPKVYPKVHFLLRSPVLRFGHRGIWPWPI
jgi:hypothetical protein